MLKVAHAGHLFSELWQQESASGVVATDKDEVPSVKNCIVQNTERDLE